MIKIKLIKIKFRNLYNRIILTALGRLTIIYFEIRSLFIIFIKNLKGKIRDFKI